MNGNSLRLHTQMFFSTDMKWYQIIQVSIYVKKLLIFIAENGFSFCTLNQFQVFFINNKGTVPLLGKYLMAIKIVWMLSFAIGFFSPMHNFWENRKNHVYFLCYEVINSDENFASICHVTYCYWSIAICNDRVFR